ncbi:hypothetical protein C8J56DRAFT_896478 [Mycena floridula]|nr:hypothetical protein C8J56DRAFT_896478 [Mycena floridula]
MHQPVEIEAILWRQEGVRITEEKTLQLKFNWTTNQEGKLGRVKLQNQRNSMPGYPVTDGETVMCDIRIGLHHQNRSFPTNEPMDRTQPQLGLWYNEIQKKEVPRVIRQIQKLSKFSDVALLNFTHSQQMSHSCGLVKHAKAWLCGNTFDVLDWLLNNRDQVPKQPASLSLLPFFRKNGLICHRSTVKALLQYTCSTRGPEKV